MHKGVLSSEQNLLIPIENMMSGLVMLSWDYGSINLRHIIICQNMKKLYKVV